MCEAASYASTGGVASVILLNRSKLTSATLRDSSDLAPTELPKRPLPVRRCRRYRNPEELKQPSYCNRGACAIHVDTHLLVSKP
jgi:hypothetical protein